MKGASKIAVLGTVGVPGRYGGFETLAENLVHHHARTGCSATLTVWCAGKENAVHADRFESAYLRYVNLRANGAQSILYDAISLWQAVRSGHDRILLLGVSGSLALPLIRLISRSHIVTNIDGIEWRREKWSSVARLVLRASEWAAVRFSHKVIADNQAIADYVYDAYDSECYVIAYGGDHSMSPIGDPTCLPNELPLRFALALCRIEPENNCHIILEAWEELDIPLVFVGNWNNSAYGRELRSRYAGHQKLYLLDPVYDPSTLRALRDRAMIYVHGHSAGGTNPSLVEMMHFGIPVLAYDCLFNRYTTDSKALWFKDVETLRQSVVSLNPEEMKLVGTAMKCIAQDRYTWSAIGEAYFDLLLGPKHRHHGAGKSRSPSIRPPSP